MRVPSVVSGRLGLKSISLGMSSLFSKADLVATISVFLWVFVHSPIVIILSAIPACKKKKKRYLCKSISFLSIRKNIVFVIVSIV